MATLKNITPDALSLFTPDAPPAQPGDEVTVSDERFVWHAWPKSTWELVKPPKDADDASTEDAYLFFPAITKSEKKPASGGKA